MEDQAHGGVPADPRPEEMTPPTQRSVDDEIRRDIVAIHRDSYGRAAADAQVHVLDDTVIVILDELEFLPNEKYLIEHGHSSVVKEVRQQFQVAIRPTFAAAVERATGRRVVAFASHAQVEEPSFAIEIFRLGPPRRE